MRIYITVKQLLVVAVFIITSSGPAVAQDAEGAASINTEYDKGQVEYWCGG